MLLGGSYTDKKFPPSVRSMGAWRNWPPERIDAATVWMRATHVYRDAPLFGASLALDGLNVVQGYLGNCWLVAAFVSVAELRPELIQRAFLHTHSRSGKWKVRLFDGSAWQVLVLDDHIPMPVSYTHLTLPTICSV